MESCFELILQSLHNHASELAHRSTMLTTENCNIERKGRPGRPAFYVQPEMLEDLLSLDFLNRKLRRFVVCQDGQFIDEYNYSIWNI